MNQDMVAQMAVEIEAARLLVYKAAWQKDQGNLNNNLEVAMAKYFAGEVVNKASNYRPADFRGLRLFHRIPGGPLLPGRPHLLHGGRLGQYLQVDRGPGSVGNPESEQVEQAKGIRYDGTRSMKHEG